MDTWDIIDNYFKSDPYYFTKHHITSYNDFVLDKLPKIIRQLNPIRIVEEQGKYIIEVTVGDKLYIDKPKIGKESLYPNMARLRDLNYVTDILADIKIKYIYRDENKIVEIPKADEEPYIKKIGSIPIMLHSKLCYLNGLNSKDLTEIGECPYDQGGYFIIDGKEKVIISQERIATNQLFITKSKEDDIEYDGLIRSTSVENSLFPKSVYFFVKKLDEELNIKNHIRIQIMQINLQEIPIFLIFRALGIESDKEILEYIAYNDIKLYQELRPCIIDMNEHNIYTQKEALKYLSNFVKYKSNNKENELDYVKYVLINNLFPNIGDDFRQKALFLGHLINKLIKVTIGIMSPNDRDNYMYKRVDTTGVLFGNIFRDFYNKFRNNIRNLVDREYTLGPGKNNTDIKHLINEGNKHKIFSDTFISEGMIKSLKGNWGLLNDPDKQGIVQDLSRLSYIGYISHVRRVNTPMDRTTKLVEPHRLTPPQYGIMCPSESPDGGNIGLLKHMSMMCEITLESSELEIKECLEDNNIIKLSDIKPFDVINKAKIILNNNWIGVHEKPNELVETFKKYRRNGILNAYISISWKIIENEIYIYSDAGRCCRQLIIVNDEKYKVNKLIDNNKYSYTYNKLKKIDGEYDMEYLDVFETNTSLISMTENEINKQTTHLEIHPSTSLSFYTNTIPFCNHNQAPRNVFSGQQGKQAIGMYATNFNHRIDTASYVLHYPQKNLVSSKISKYVHKDLMPNGENLIVAIATYTGYNQEDSIIINKNSIERGLFNVSAFKSVVDTEDHSNDDKIIFANAQELKKDGKNIEFKYAKWDKIDKFGFPIENKYISEDDVYLGKVSMNTKDTRETVFSDFKKVEYYKDKSIIADKTLNAIVDKVYVHSEGKTRKMKMRMRKFRIPVLGDKLASSHGQKGVIGMIIPQEDMPFNKDGITPDIIVNPHAFPSRMTIGHIIECVLAKVGLLEGIRIDGTAFDNTDHKSYFQILEKYGYNKYGDEILYNGLTGEQMSTQIFFGPTFYYRLKHMVKDKMNYRNTGPKESLTRQPTHGRASGGGLRIGEMETNAIIAHGIQSFTKESMMERSDKYELYMDKESGDIAIFNENDNRYEYNDSTNITKVKIPYTFKLLTQELGALGIGTKAIFDEDKNIE